LEFRKANADADSEGAGRTVKARFLSADGLSLDTDITYPPFPRMARWMKPPMNSSVLDSGEISIKRVTRERHYELTGKDSDGIWIYEEIV